MGSKTVVDQTPWKPAQPYILQGLENSGRVFNSTQPALEGYAGDQRATYGRLAPGAETGITSAQALTNRVLSGQMNGLNPGQAAYMAAMTPRTTNDYTGAVQPSRDYYRNVMNGGFLNGNPYLDSAINYAIDDANNAANGQFSAAGRYGSGAHAGVLAREAGRISSNARMAAYDAERNRMDAAAGNYGSMGLQALGADEQARAAAQGDALKAAGMADSGYWADADRQQTAIGNAQDLMRGSQSVLDSAAQLPWYGVGALNGNVRQASNGYGTTTTTQSPGLGSIIGGIGGGVLSAAGAAGGFGKLFSDPRTKTNVKPVGVRPDGLGVYQFNYKPGFGPPGKQIGVMADEVAANRPDALGPTVGGLMTVDYGKLLDQPGGMTPGIGDQHNRELGDLSSAMPPASDSVALSAKQLRPSLGTRLDRAFSNAVDPNPNRPGAALSMIGAAMMAQAEHTPFAGIGQALLAGRKDAAARADAMAERERQASRDALDERYKMALIDKAARQDAPDAPASVQEWQYYSGLSPEQQRAYREMKRGMGPLVPVDVNGQPIYTPASQAVGKPQYRAPARAAAGGGLTANAAVKLRADAAAAIAAGADPAKVQARLRQMGVQ